MSDLFVRLPGLYSFFFITSLPAVKSTTFFGFFKAREFFLELYSWARLSWSFTELLPFLFAVFSSAILGILWF